MIDKVAHAICDAQDVHLRCSFPDCSCADKMRRCAKAALSAMREPTFDMVMRSLDVPWKNGKTSYGEAYRAMIDDALSK